MERARILALTRAITAVAHGKAYDNDKNKKRHLLHSNLKLEKFLLCCFCCYSVFVVVVVVVVVAHYTIVWGSITDIGWNNCSSVSHFYPLLLHYL